MLRHALFIFAFLGGVTPHGRLMDPPGRSTMWRYGWDAPPNYNDNQLYCGGRARQWEQNNGSCGMCGDPWDMWPRPNEYPGKYAQGIVTRNYTQGQVIKVKIEITASHGGEFEFRLCPLNRWVREGSQACLNRFRLRRTNGARTFKIPLSEARVYEIAMKLPRHVTCRRCVLQWIWKTANSWGCYKNKKCCIGCGPQEQFRGCADIAIKRPTKDNGEPVVQLPTGLKAFQIPYGVNPVESSPSWPSSGLSVHPSQHVKPPWSPPVPKDQSAPPQTGGIPQTIRNPHTQTVRQTPPPVKPHVQSSRQSIRKSNFQTSNSRTESRPSVYRKSPQGAVVIETPSSSLLRNMWYSEVSSNNAMLLAPREDTSASYQPRATAAQTPVKPQSPSPTVMWSSKQAVAVPASIRTASAQTLAATRRQQANVGSLYSLLSSLIRGGSPSHPPRMSHSSSSYGSTRYGSSQYSNAGSRVPAVRPAIQGTGTQNLWNQNAGLIIPQIISRQQRPARKSVCAPRYPRFMTNSCGSMCVANSQTCYAKSPGTEVNSTCSVLCKVVQS